MLLKLRFQQGSNSTLLHILNSRSSTWGAMAPTVHIGARWFATRTLFVGVSGNRRPQTARQIDMALKPVILTILMFGLSRGLGVTSELSENSQASANELVRKIVAHEIKAETQD